MKKSIFLSVAIIFVMAIMMLAFVTPVSALISTGTLVPRTIFTTVPTTAVDAGPANGGWEAKAEGATGSEIPTMKISAVSPNEWSRMLSKGFAVSGRTEVCHPFRGGQFGWHTSIFLLEGSSWTEIPTTVEWYPDEEGELRACAFAPVTGTYAMFGYWEWFEGFEVSTPEPFFN